MSNQIYESVIGLEIHAQLSTESKIFSGASTEFSDGDNDHITPVCVGMPGTLPVLNKQVIHLAIRTGLALNCEIKDSSIFARKQYFYPDLPKGYQISQYDQPICLGGYVEFFLGEEKKRVHLERAHLEEDAGKSTHHGDYTLINLNRAGIPLMEIVSRPDMRSPLEAAEYAKAVRQILRYVGVCDGNLEEGSLRCDCNVSIRKKGDNQLGTKVELKNLNSFKFIEKALEYEIQRQIHCMDIGEEIVQETRLYDSAKNKTVSMRTKEQAEDYRYFPDPDLLSVRIEASYVEAAKKDLPELPMEKFNRFQDEYGIPAYDAHILTQEKDLAEYYEEVVRIGGNAKLSSNWVMGELLGVLKESKVELKDVTISARKFGELVKLIDQGDISGKMAKQVFSEMWKTKKSAKVLIQTLGLEQITDESAIQSLVNEVVSKNPDQVAQYKAGKTKVFGFFVGQVMKASKGQANPDLVNKLLHERLK